MKTYFEAAVFADLKTNFIHRKRRSTDDQETSQIRVYEVYEPKTRPVVVHSHKEALEAKDLANDTFFYEKLKASIPTLKDGEKDDVELIKNGKPRESLTDDSEDSVDDDDADDGDESDEKEDEDESSESDESSDESDGNEETDKPDKSSQTMKRPATNKNVEFVQHPDRALKEVEKAFHNNNKYIEEKQRQADEDDGDSGDSGDGSEEHKMKKPVFKTKHFSRDFESTGDLLREVHSLVNKKKGEPGDGNGYWKVEYENPIV